MQKRILIILSASGIGLIVGFLAGQYGGSQESQKVEARQEVKAKTVTRIVERPSGERITEITEVRSEKLELKAEKKVSKPDWILGATYALYPEPIYGVQGSMRVLGPIFVGGYIRTDSEAGIILQVEF